jgi:hypothetical protein
MPTVFAQGRAETNGVAGHRLTPGTVGLRPRLRMWQFLTRTVAVLQGRIVHERPPMGYDEQTT